MSAATDLLKFIDASPSPFHAVSEIERRLRAGGFQKLSETDALWTTSAGGKYFVTRGQSSVVAFTLGGRFVPGGSATIVAAHTDSPCLRVKPISTRNTGGYQSVGVETYGGGIWHSWFDRDLSIAGRVVVAVGGGKYESKLVRIDRPILRVPTLAIHLDRTVNDGFKVNTETHLPAILATAVRAALEDPRPLVAATPAAMGTGAALTRHHAGLVRVLGEALGVSPDAVCDFELCLYDTQPAALGGLYNEFVFAPRLDNLAMTHAAIEGLLSSVGSSEGAAITAAEVSDLASDASARIVATFNHEEVGSASTTGAGGTLLEDVLLRLAGGAPAMMAAAARKSIIVSADMACVK